jgi:hypothetical protein
MNLELDQVESAAFTLDQFLAE